MFINKILPVIKIDLVYIPSDLKFILDTTNIKSIEAKEYIAVANKPEQDLIGTLIEVEKINNSKDVLIYVRKKVRIIDVLDNDTVSYKSIYHIGTADSQTLNILKNKITTSYNELRKINPVLSRLVIDISEPLECIIAQITHIIQKCCIKCIHLVQEILEQNNDIERVSKTIDCINLAIQNSRIEQKTAQETAEIIKKKNNDFIINEQIKVLQDKLSTPGGVQMQKNQIAEWRKKAEELSPHMPEEAINELNTLINAVSKAWIYDETYVKAINFILALPWKAKQIGDLHFEMLYKELKSKIVGHEKILVQLLENIVFDNNHGHKIQKTKRLTICLVGPPGVGKSCIAEYCAQVLGINFIKISLAGISDLQSLIGFSKTYKNSEPGKFTYELLKMPLGRGIILLDEIDKIGGKGGYDKPVENWLLKLLDDPSEYKDDFLNIPFPLKNFIFIVTANSLSNISAPLRNRLQVCHINGYDISTKLNIAKTYFNAEIKNLGFNYIMSDEAILYLIEHYTREAGTRDLLKIMLQILKKHVIHHPDINDITTVLIDEYVHIENKVHKDRIYYGISGIANGLGYTSFGGTLMAIEVTFVRKTGKDIITGNAKQIIVESLQVSANLVRSEHAQEVFKKYFSNPPVCNIHEVNIHVHCFDDPHTPKDGPSAGITMACAIITELYDIKLAYSIAMTGAITLKGYIKPVGGIPEKVMAAVASGAEVILLPHNAEETYDLTSYVQGKQIIQNPISVECDFSNNIHIHYISTLEDLCRIICMYQTRNTTNKKSTTEITKSITSNTTKGKVSTTDKTTHNDGKKHQNKSTK